LEDRIKHYIKVINKAAGKKIDLLVKKQKDTDVKYELILENDKYSSEFIDAIKQLGFKLNKDTWTYLLQ
jgi:disulfide oxidoreductase YuzD